MSAPAPEWVRAIIKSVRAVAPKEFCGLVEVNMQFGNITNVVVKQSFKEESPVRRS